MTDNTRVNDDQKRYARNTDLYSYLIDTEPTNWHINPLKDTKDKQIRSTIDGCDCIVTKGLGYWFVDGRKKDENGNNAISFLMNYRDCSFVEAVQKLCKYRGFKYGMNVSPKTIEVSNTDTMRERRKNLNKGEIVLPAKEKDNKRVFAYLCNTRKIDRKIVANMIKNNRLYQDEKGNCVFVSPDSKTAELKGTLTEKPFVQELTNSDSIDSPIIVTTLTNDELKALNDFKGYTVAVTEAVIDALSLQELILINACDVKVADSKKLIVISMGGLKHNTLKAIKDKYVNADFYLAIDNDTKADEFYQKNGQGFNRIKIAERYGKDVNDVLKYIKNNKK